MNPTPAPTFPAPASCVTLLSRLQRSSRAVGQKIRFSGVGDRDVYNISAPFRQDGREIIAGRVESRAIEHSAIMFFAPGAGAWRPLPTAPILDGLQDPCITFVGGELILGGVRFPVTMTDGTAGWRMEFYRGADLNHLHRFLAGPDKMKDIRLVALADQRVGVLTRPQGAKGGRGKIGFFIADRLESITAEAMEEAPLFPGQCHDDEWLGANEAHLLANGRIGVLGHIAYFDPEEHRHYYPMIFILDPATGRATAPEIIACRADFPNGPAKRPDLADVMFSGGLIRSGGETATLYAGLSDAEAGCLELPDPFQDHETSVSHR